MLNLFRKKRFHKRYSTAGLSPIRMTDPFLRLFAVDNHMNSHCLAEHGSKRQRETDAKNDNSNLQSR